VSGAQKRQLATYTLRRVGQTVRTFANWPALLAGMVRERTGGGPDTLTFVTRTGQRITCPNEPGARLPAYEQYAEDRYQLAWFLGPLAVRPLHAVDVGAHVGTFACRFGQVHPHVTIECFEPSGSTAGFLRRNIAANGLADRVTVTESALAAETGWATFDDNGSGSVHNGLVHGDDRLVQPQGADIGGVATKVRTTCFDDVVAAAPAAVEFVKMDCEGGEYEFVYASSPASWDTVRRIVVEYHPVQGESWDQLRAWFAERGLIMVRHEPVRDGLGTAWLSRDAA
jgi:FkbM family methyltransferase